MKTAICKACNFEGQENFCARCGQPFTQPRITFRKLLHDVFHLFTHLDKGFAFTVRQLIAAPGRMQREYIEGERYRHQKPFSMFFISVTVLALLRYWTYNVVLQIHGSMDVAEANFFHEYMVIVQIAMMPFYTFVVYLLFRESKLNYAETGVFMLYTVSFFFLGSILLLPVKMLAPDLEMAYIEIPVFLTYNTITFINFFNKSPRWLVAIKSILIMITIFLLARLIESNMIGWLEK